MAVKIKTFEKDGKTFPTIELCIPSKPGSERPNFGFTFGVSKARLILENLDDIRKFVADNTRAAGGQ